MDDTLNSSFLSILSNMSELSINKVDVGSDSFSEFDSFDCLDLSVDFPEEPSPEKEKRPYEFHDRRLVQTASKMSPVLFRSHFRVTKGKLSKLFQFLFMWSP